MQPDITKNAKERAESAGIQQYESLVYPSDLGSASGGRIQTDKRHYMLFNINVPAKSNFKKGWYGSKNRATDKVDNTGAALTRSVDKSAFASTGLPESVQRTGANIFQNTPTRTEASIILPTPTQVSTSYGATWNSNDVGVMGAQVGAIINGLKSMENAGASGAPTSDLLKSFGSQVAPSRDAVNAGLATALGGIDEGTGAGAKKLAQMILNPFTETTFQGMQNRTFSFVWKMTPKNQAEADTIRQIIKMFKFHMAPEILQDESGLSTVMLFPSQFDISFHYIQRDGEGNSQSVSNEENLFKLDSCALTGVEINFAPQGQYRTFEDGHASEIDMTLNFQELTILTKDKYKNGNY